MAGIVSSVLEFVATHPFATTLVTVIVLFVFGAYLFLRKTITEFRKGLEGS